MSKRIVSKEAIGKIILIGEHSVVHHKPALAIPFSGVSMKVSVEESEGQDQLNCFSYSGRIKDAPDRFLGLTSVIQRVSETLNQSLENLSITIESSIPVERGMGSSAAVAAASVRALYAYFNEDLSDEDLRDHVNVAETITHGNPSGIDTAIVVYEKPLYYIKNEPIEIYDFKIDAYLIVSDTGEMGNTKYAVSKVKDFIDQNQSRGKVILDSLESLAIETKVNLRENKIDEIANALNTAQLHLSELGVSNDTIDSIVKASLAHGALASKLTGGGLGGCVITLCKDKESAERISKELLNHGAKQSWIMDMSGDKYES